MRRTLPLLPLSLLLAAGPAGANDGMVPDLDAEAGPLPDALVIDHAYVRLFMGIRDSVPATALRGGTPHTGELEVVLLQPPDGYFDSAWRCTLRWTDLAATATPLDVSAWPDLWAGWRLDPTVLESSSDGCTLLDSQRWGDDPAVTTAAAGWNIGIGPQTASMLQSCPFAGALPELVTVYVWMDGALPMPAGLAQALALDADGNTIGEDVPGASTATSLPPDLFVHQLCAASFGI
ncbi:MAG: hypothetical protein H6742_14500 [Alphaproteobacteria bacterium]|nr:hypothetical protein [Alphaproteobacteria bacterium]